MKESKRFKTRKNRRKFNKQRILEKESDLKLNAQEETIISFLRKAKENHTEDNS